MRVPATALPPLPGYAKALQLLSEFTVNRIELSPLLPWELEDVLETLRHTEFIQLLRHHPDIHLNHLRLLRLHRQPLWPGMLSLVNNRSSTLDIGWVCRMTRDTLTMTNGNLQPLSRVKSRSALQSLHDRLVRQLNSGVRKDQAEALAQRHGKYPTPPVPAPKGIEPITSWLDLLEEGAVMQHCVGSYDRRVAEGEVFIYRMVKPERLTVSLIYRNNRWMLGEVRRRRNGTPAPRVMEFIRRWVERN
ncbi:MAG: PcfJ domain-containing protein [Alteromonadaceae bacterium]|nr:PcfJ domain-containing protein [Alteromonadaceae bacterium]